MCRVFEYKRINLSSRGEYFRAHWQPKQLNGRYYDINLYRVWYTFFIRFALSLWLRYVITHAIICFKRISARKRWTMNKKTHTHQIYLNAQRSALENTVSTHRLEFVLLLFLLLPLSPSRLLASLLSSVSFVLMYAVFIFHLWSLSLFVFRFSIVSSTNLDSEFIFDSVIQF